jgi:CheY-like chemotaxis protein
MIGQPVHAVVTACNGKEALNHFMAEKPDVVVTDLRMPVMSGNVLIRKVRALDTEVPIIVMTGHAMPADEEQATKDGAFAVMRKPIRMRDLTALINGLPNPRASETGRRKRA